MRKLTWRHMQSAVVMMHRKVEYFFFLVGCWEAAQMVSSMIRDVLSWKAKGSEN